MATDVLESLLKLRRLAIDQARLGVVECLAREDQAERTLADAGAVLAREMLAAQASAADADVEAFVAWLPQGRLTIQKAQEARDAAVAETTLGRAALALARSAAEGVETLIEQRRRLKADEAARREQTVLDEIGQRKSVQE